MSTRKKRRPEDVYEEDLQPRLVDAVADMLLRFRVLRTIERKGDGDISGKDVATFSLFGVPMSDNPTLVLDVYLRLLFATKNFKRRIFVGKDYRLDESSGSPQLSYGFFIAGACTSKEEVEAIREALDLSEWYGDRGKVTHALFFQRDPTTNTLSPSGPRNAASTSSNSPDGNKGVYLRHDPEDLNT